MDRLARWLILAVATGVALALTATLVAVASSPATSGSFRPDPGVSQSEQDRATPTALMEPDLAKALVAAAPNERLNVIVEMRTQAVPTILVQGQATEADARRHMVEVMQSTAQQTQFGVRAYLAARRLAGDVVRVKPFWIFNGLAVTGAQPNVVRDLAARPDVALLRLDHWRQWIEVDLAAPNGTAHPAKVPSTVQQPGQRSIADWRSAMRDAPIEWGLERIRASAVWESLGIDGDGIVVANVDTGVDWQHPALQPRYRGYSPKGFHQHDGNWFDATDEGTLYPVDGFGHGSHTMGTLVGAAGVGVAPGASWIAARGFDNGGYAFDSWLHAAFEWLLAPNGDPDLAPRIVNNSWGNSRGRLTTFQRDLQALRAAGIFAVFSVGNDGPGEGSVGSPASLPGAFSVGASDQDDEVAVFSGRGPSPWGEWRPHIVAPGVNIRSTLPGGTYAEWQGTSMAAPHIAGVVALMLSAQPDLTITQTAYILTSTAVPLGAVVPNNNSGYGRVDAYAAVALAANAGVISGTVHSDGTPLAGATVHASPVFSGSEGTATSDSHGRYQLFLGAGYYDLTIGAFGYAPQSVHAASVIKGMTTVENFDLTSLPTGRLRGTVATPDGEVVQAQVKVLGTPVSTTSKRGKYQLNLPSGRYTLEARALGYRVVTATVTVTAGEDSFHHFVLPESMRVLLIDSGTWYYQSQASYYREALDGLSYAYDDVRLKHLTDDVPTLTELLAYDLVIWSAPNDSPGAVGAGAVISDYLNSGRNLLLSGQDVGFWDGGGYWSLQPYYVDYLHSLYSADDVPSRQVTCLDDGAFGGISVTIRGGDGADNQSWPDAIEVWHPDHASLACSYEGGQGAVVQAGFCNAHRGLNLGFGFEAINSAPDRAAFMARALDWFTSPRKKGGVELLPKTAPLQIAPPGGAVTHTFRLRNLAEIGSRDRIRIRVEGDEWTTTVLTPTRRLEPCDTATVGVRVDIPSGVTWGMFDVVTVTARSLVSPAVSQRLTVTSKTPAPVLLVDDDRWYDQAQAYEDALRASDLPYDRWEVTDSTRDKLSPVDVLAWYPVVLWFTGYDWFDPLQGDEADRLVSYLKAGGRLFLSSQDAVDVVGESELFRDFFGVMGYSDVLSHTAVQGVPAHLLGDGLGVADLTYPYKNWSDSLLPALGSQVAFRGQHGQPSALTREGICSDSYPSCYWRSAFFAFPFEALPASMRETLMSRLVGWLSWMGGSELRADREVAQLNEVVSYSLVLHNDGPEALLGASVSNTVPAGTLLVDGPYGGADYDARNRTITWTGDLDPGAAITFTYRLQLTGEFSDGVVHNTAKVSLGEQGIRFQRRANVRIATSNLSASRLDMFPDVPILTSPAVVGASTEVTVTILVRNSGLADAHSASVDNHLPWPLRLITGTLSVAGGGTVSELLEENRVLWEGEVTVRAPVTLTYRAVAPAVIKAPLWLYNAARFDDGLGGAWERGEWVFVEPQRLYMPLFFKGS